MSNHHIITRLGRALLFVGLLVGCTRTFDPNALAFPCTANSDCSDGWVCVAETCVVAGSAATDVSTSDVEDTFTPDVGPPDTGPEKECNIDSDCLLVLGQPGVCRAVECDDGQCAERLADDDSPCDDGNPCSIGDVCLAGACGGAPNPCDDNGPCFSSDCVPGVGCSNTPLSGPPCDDGQECTVGDTCNNGVCDGGGSNCDDGIPCTVDSCTADGCRHEPSPSLCPQENACQVVQCNPLEGCELLFEVECDDGNACNGKETCSPFDGSCVAGIPLDCQEDGNVCNGVTACNPATGVCEFVTPPLNCLDDDLCNGVEKCDPVLGCVLEDPTPCDDGENNDNPCLQQVVCENKACVTKTGLDCGTFDENKPCAGTPVCDPFVGCTFVDIPAGCCSTDADCDDGNACNGTETCTGDGTCQSSGPLQCDDGLYCNGLETCDPDSGCIPGTTQCEEDGNKCNGTRSCDEEADACTVSPAPECNDGIFCNGFETCDPETGCVAGEPVECDDGNLCDGVELCTENGCQPGIPLQCNDGQPCNGTEYCDPQTGCVVGDPLPGCCTQVNDCEDGNACNGQWACNLNDAGEQGLGSCVLSVPPPDCNDEDTCTLDACDPESGSCVHTPNPVCAPPSN